MKHPNVLTLERLYSDFSRGDIASVLAACADTVTFQVPGKSRLAGKYTRENFEKGFHTQLQELSGGTFELEVHDILAGDQHAAVLATSKLSRNGKSVELRTVHIWRFQGAKPLAGYEYPRDLYQYDATWDPA
jgi:ketosteroid isomerase-like protein